MGTETIPSYASDVWPPYGVGLWAALLKLAIDCPCLSIQLSGGLRLNTGFLPKGATALEGETCKRGEPSSGAKCSQ